MDDFDFLSRAARDTEAAFRAAVLATERETRFDARSQHADLDRAAAAARDELVAYVNFMEAANLSGDAAAAGVVVTLGEDGALLLSGAVTAKVYSDRQALEHIRDPKLSTGSAASRLSVALARLCSAVGADNRTDAKDRLPWVEDGRKLPFQSGRLRETADRVLSRRERAAWEALVRDLKAETAADLARKNAADDEEEDQGSSWEWELTPERGEPVIFASESAARHAADKMGAWKSLNPIRLGCAQAA